MSEPLAVSPVVGREAEELLRELDSYRAAIQNSFSEGFAMGGMRSHFEDAWSRSDARQTEAMFALTRIAIGFRYRELLVALVPRPEPRAQESPSLLTIALTADDLYIVRLALSYYANVGTPPARLNEHIAAARAIELRAAVRPASVPSLEPRFPKGHPALCYELCDPTFEVTPHIHTPKGVYVVEVEP
jgi:hypothetical protein